MYLSLECDEQVLGGPLLHRLRESKEMFLTGYARVVWGARSGIFSSVEIFMHAARQVAAENALLHN
jgi:hypothetical protein